MHSIRAASSGELGSLQAIRAEVLPEASASLLEYCVTGPPVALTTRAPTEGIVGYVIAIRDRQEKAAQLVSLAIVPSARREGHGRALVDAVVARLADHDRLHLLTPADNTAAVEFYETLGFERDGQLDGFYI
jgi:ribosomal protein S18 acetylase RimI-like enzyme